jgi:hypothetical protein
MKYSQAIKIPKAQLIQVTKSMSLDELIDLVIEFEFNISGFDLVVYNRVFGNDSNAYRGVLYSKLVFLHNLITHQ